MGLDLSRVPDVVRPLARPLTGGALPEADVDGIIAEARTLESLADHIATIKSEDAGAVTRMLRDQEWQGLAKEAFEKSFAVLGGQPDAAASPTGEALLDLLERALREEAAALREHGVRMQHTEWMIYAALALLGAVIVRLLVWIYVNGPAVLGLIQHNALLTRLNIQMTKRLVLVNMLKFGGIMGGLDLGVQTAQQIWGDRAAGDFDVASLAMSAGSGALTGALFAGANAGLSRLLSQNTVYVASKAELAVRDKIVAIGQSMYGQAAMGGVAGTAGAVPGLALSGQLDASHLAFTFLSGLAGGVDVPAGARVSYLPMDAVAQLGDPTPAGPSTPSPTPPAHLSPPPANPAPPPAHLRPSADPAPPLAPMNMEPSRTALARTEADAPVEPRADLPQPHDHGVIVGEVTQRHDTLLPGPVGDRADSGATGHRSGPGAVGERAEPGGALARPQQGLPAEQAPAAGITPGAGAANPGGLARSSLLPATVPAVVSATSEAQASATAEPSPPREDRPEPTPREDRPEPAQRRLADGSTSEVPPHPLGQASAHSPGEALPHQTPPASARGPQPPVTDPQPVTPHAPPSPTPEPAASQGASSTITPRAETPLPDPAPASSSDQGQRVPDLRSDPDTLIPRSAAPPETPPQRVEPMTRQVADLLGRDDADEPVGIWPVGAWPATPAPAVRTPMDPVRSPAPDLPGLDRRQGPHLTIDGPPHAAMPGHSPAADPRPRNFAEAAAIVHRWTPDPPDRRENGPPNRIERLLNGSPDRTGPAADAELLAEGRRLMEQLPVLDRSDTTARTLASMSRIIDSPNPRRAFPELAASLGLDVDVDALVELFNDARRYDMSPDTAPDRTALADVLSRLMEADHHRWMGYWHQKVFSLQETPPAQARTIGLMIEMMGPPITSTRARIFVTPALKRYGLPGVTQLLPLVQAAHQHGHFPRGTTGEAEFTAAMDRFRQEDPYLWNGLLLAEQHSLTGLRDSTARLTARLNEIVARPFDVVSPLERLAREAGQGGAVEHLVRLAEEAQAQGADLARAAGPQEVVDGLLAYRARDLHLWDGMRIAAENGFPRPSHDEARALARLAEITGAERPSRLWVFDPLRRLAGDAGLDHSVERLAQQTVEAQRNGFDLFGPVDRRQVLDALTRHADRSPSGRPPDIPPGLHDLSPERVREARQAAAHEHAEAHRTYHESGPAPGRIRSVLTGPDPQALAAQERVASLEARAQAWQRWPERPEVSFTRDFAAYLDAYDRAVQRAVRGEPVIPYLLDDATAALAARDGGRGFGVEIEFDLPEHVARESLAAIARALHEAGLTTVAYSHDYHTMRDSGYRSGRNGGLGLWMLELDGTVAGELVSPILYDEPATWENLRAAVEIIRAHGGTASPKTGGHVHVSTHDYDHIVENYTSVLRHAGHHTDTLFRLAHNPERDSHRGLQYAHPNLLPAAGYESLTPVLRYNSSHELAVNMQAMRGTSKDHIEFRMWDGSLDPAVIQAQVKVSLALVEAAFRNAMLDDPPNLGRHDALGAHAGPHSAPDRTEQGSLSFRVLADELFWRTADKEQLTALYAATRWGPA